VKAWVDAVFNYWGNDVSGFTPMGRRGVDVFREVFARSFEVAPLMSSQLADQEARRLILTKDQTRARLLAFSPQSCCERRRRYGQDRLGA